MSDFSEAEAVYTRHKWQICSLCMVQQLEIVGWLISSIKNNLPNQYCSDHNTVVSLNRWLREPGVLNVERFGCGWGGLSALGGLRKQVMNVVADTSSSSTCWFGHAIYESYTAVWQIMHLQQQLLHSIHQWKLQLVSPTNYLRWQVIGHWFLQCMFWGAWVSVCSEMLIYSDVTVDSHHSHVWAEENPLTTVNQSYQCVV